MTNEFTYEGLNFKPLETLSERSANIFEILKRITDIKITPDNWDYDEFYKIAKENNADKIDLFEVNGRMVIPVGNLLYEYQVRNELFEVYKHLAY